MEEPISEPEALQQPQSSNPEPVIAEQHDSVKLSKKKQKRLERQRRWAEYDKKKREERQMKRKLDREERRANMTPGFFFRSSIIFFSFSFKFRGT